MASVVSPRICGASTTAEFEHPLTYDRTHKGTATYYCTAEPHDPMEDHEAQTATGPLTWFDPTEGETPDE